jgi:FAD/FMN-containing dehydrogenase
MTHINPSTAPIRGPANRNGDLEALRARLTGEIINSLDSGYDAARKVVYMTVDCYPRAFVRAADANDVAETVRFARDHALPLAVRSGGHSMAHYSIIDDTLVVDLSGMKGIHIDPETHVVRVQAGCTSGDLAGPAHAHGLALSTGDTHSVGLGGLTTGGGIGFMVRKQGLTIDNLLAAQVVTANGDIITASADENAELFWGIRGGGGNFGIITEFTYRVASVGQILGGELLLPVSRAVIRGYLDYVVTAPDELTTIAKVRHAPPMAHVPPEHVGQLVLSILLCWTGPTEDGERALAPLRALARPIADTISPMPYPDIYKFTMHQGAPHGSSIRSMFTDSLSDSAIDAILDAMKQSPSAYSLIQLRGLGGAMARVPTDSTAFAHRDKRYFLAIIGMWLDATEDPGKYAAWTEALWQAIRSEGSGVYVNFLEREGEDRVRDSYTPASFARLAALKRAVDPQNMFRFNQNISPQT